MRVSGDAGIFPVQDARVQYVLRVPVSEVRQFFTKHGILKKTKNIDETNIPNVMDPQLVDMGINVAVGQHSDHSFDFYARQHELRDFLLNAFRYRVQTGVLADPAAADACNAALKAGKPKHILIAVWADRIELVEHARLAIHIRGNRVTKTSELAELTAAIRRGRLVNSLKQGPPSFDAATAPLKTWVRMVTAFTFGGKSPFDLSNTTMSSVAADPLRTIDLGEDMYSAYARMYGEPWCKSLQTKARLFVQTSTGDFGIADGRGCVFAAPRAENEPPEFGSAQRTSESMAYHTAGETRCYDHPMLFDTKLLETRDTRVLLGAGLAVKSEIMANTEWILLESSNGTVELHRANLNMREATNELGFKTRMRLVSGLNSDFQSLSIDTITGTTVGANEIHRGILDGGNSPGSYKHVLFLNVFDGKAVGLPLSAAMIMSRACAGKQAYKALMDIAYVRADADDFGEADARVAALLAAFFKRVGVMVPHVSDDDDSEQAVRQRAHNARCVRLVGDEVEVLRRVLTRDDADGDEEGGGAALGQSGAGWDDVGRVAKRQRLAAAF
jgi:hypothetical protein